MRIRIDIPVAFPGQVLATYDQIQIERSKNGRKSGEAVFTEITIERNPAAPDSDMRPALEAGKSTYTFIDEEACIDAWYRARYYNSTTFAVSAYSEPFQGDVDSALDILSVAEFKTNFLWGVDLSKDDGEEMPDSLHEFYIKSAVSYLEQRLDLPIRAKDFTEYHDYYADDVRSFYTFPLDHYPVIEVKSVKLNLSNDSTAGQEFDPATFRLQESSGHLNILAGPGMPGVFPMWSPFSTRNGFFPGAFEIKYRAGFRNGNFPGNVREMIGKIASYGPLNIAGDLVGGAGLAASSLSIDGLSQSVTTTNSSTNAGFGARIILYRKEVNDQIKVIKDYFKGIRMTVV